MVELVDTLALGASVARREGSSPFIRTSQYCSFLIREDCRKASVSGTFLYSPFMLDQIPLSYTTNVCHMCQNFHVLNVHLAQLGSVSRNKYHTVEQLQPIGEVEKNVCIC